MPVQTLSEALDNLYTTTWLHLKSEAIDNIFDATPFWFWMRENGRFKEVTGGRKLLEAVEYAKNDDVQFIGRGGTVPLNDREFLTEAVYDWHYIVAPIVRFGQDDQKNRGKTRIMNYAMQKLGNAQTSMVDTLENVLFDGDDGSGNGAVGGAFDGLQLLVNDAGTGTVGGINAATYTWWQNQFADATAVSSFAEILPTMRNVWNDCMNNRMKDRPDILVTDQVSFELYEGIAVGNDGSAGTGGSSLLRISNTKLLDLGFDSLAFKGAPLIWSPDCPARTLYMLNTNFLWFVYDPGMFFDMTEWKPIPDQVNDRAAQIITACSFVTNRRKVHGVIHTLPTA